MSQLNPTAKARVCDLSDEEYYSYLETIVTEDVAIVKCATCGRFGVGNR